MWICLSRLTSTLSVSELYIAKIILIISRSFRVAMFCKYAHHIFHACSICTTKVYKQSHILEKSWNAWSSPQHTTQMQHCYQQIPYFRAFLVLKTLVRITTLQKKYFTLQDLCPGVFFCDNCGRIYLSKIVLE